MSASPVDVAVITINFNSADYTVGCVESILDKTPESLGYEIIVVDNNSSDEDFARLGGLEDHPRVRVVRSDINRGFSGGHMFGTQFSRPDYYFFLNNDCVLLNDCLSSLVGFCRKNPKVALCSPQLYSGGMHRQATYDYFPSLVTKLLGTGLLRLFNRDRYPDKKVEYTSPLKVDLVSGSAMFVAADLFDELGGFDTGYFLYCEEEDLAIRFNRAGYEVYLIPEAHVQHFGGGSTKRNLDIEKEYYISFLRFYRKHYGRMKTQVLKVFLLLRLLKRSLRSAMNLKLAMFVLTGAPQRHSLRHRQQARSE